MNRVYILMTSGRGVLVLRSQVGSLDAEEDPELGSL